jgi:FlaA1/EpsC-like NDP-sugar epimerase
MARSALDWARFLPPFGAGTVSGEFARVFSNQVVCIAGAGGYLGSALVRALAPAGLQCLILLDSSEFGLFQVQRFLETAHPAIRSKSVLGSVCDAGLLDGLFEYFRPHIVIHAAAFKHVGMMEQNPFAAIENNALGTYVLTQAAMRHRVEKVLLVSTDKAVNPHSVMGVSKRIAELLTVSLSTHDVRTNVVRLGNVIGSPGSVVPIFLENIAKGKPVCVTHADATRYFLSQQEAATAILTAGSADCQGKLLIPESADAVHIVALARFLIGTQPTASAIRFTGLRPGEKMTEEFVGASDSYAGTIDGPLSVWDTPRLSPEQCTHVVQRLTRCVAGRDRASLVETLCSIVPEYVPSILMQENAVALSGNGSIRG